MRLNETFDVDYQEIQKVLDEINGRFAVRERSRPEKRERRVIGLWMNCSIRFVESNGIDWCPGVIVDLAVVRPVQRVALLRAIAEVYFSQGWESGEAPQQELAPQEQKG